MNLISNKFFALINVIIKGVMAVMASYNYMTAKTDVGRKSIDVNELITKAKIEKKREKKNTLAIVTAAISTLAVAVLIIAL